MMQYKNIIYNKYTSSISRQDNISIHGLKRWSSYYRAHYHRFLPKNKEAKILDVGCGYGRVLYFLKSEEYKNIYGIDISQQQVEMAQQFGFNQTRCISAVDFLEGKDNQFEVIIMFDVLEHIEKFDIIKLLNKVFLSLRFGGRLILQLPNALTPLNVNLYRDFTHETEFTSISINQILSITGFKDIKVFPILPHIHGPVSLMMNLMWRIIWQNFIRFYMFTANGDLMGDIYTSNFIAVAEKK